jgi:hypothetical protein
MNFKTKIVFLPLKIMKENKNFRKKYDNQTQTERILEKKKSEIRN